MTILGKVYDIVLNPQKEIHLTFLFFSVEVVTAQGKGTVMKRLKEGVIRSCYACQVVTKKMCA